MTQLDTPSAPSQDLLGAPRLLHLGCGFVAPPQWVNVEGSFNAWLAQHPRLRSLLAILHLAPRSHLEMGWPNNLIIADLRKPLPFKDATFDAVFSSHVLEHLYRDEAVALLKESHRVLKPAGRCRNVVPDLADIVSDYVNQSRALASDPTAQPARDPARDMVLRLRMRDEQYPRRGLLYTLYRSRTDFHPHKWMYDSASLAMLMEEAGFSDCRPRKHLQTDIPHIDKVERPDRAAGAAIVEGVKA